MDPGSWAGMTESAHAVGQIKPCRRGDAVDREQSRAVQDDVRRRAAWRSVRPSRPRCARVLCRYAEQPDRANRADCARLTHCKIPREEPAWLPATRLLRSA